MSAIAFVDFPAAGLSGHALTEQQKAMQDIQLIRSYNSALAEDKIQEQVQAKSFPANDAVKTGNYRVKVLDTTRQGPWFAKTQDRAMKKRIMVKKTDFHTAILDTALEGFSIPGSVFPSLEKVLDAVNESIVNAAGQFKGESQQFWFMLTKYNYSQQMRETQTTVRFLYFTISGQYRDYIVGKSEYKSIDLELEYNLLHCVFNNDIFAAIKRSFRREQVAKGDELAKAKTFTVEVPVDTSSRRNDDSE